MESVDSEALTGTSQAKAELVVSADLAASAESVASAASKETSPRMASEEPEELLASLELMVSAKRRMQLPATMVPDLLAPALLDSDSRLVESDQTLALILAVLI